MTLTEEERAEAHEYNFEVSKYYIWPAQDTDYRLTNELTLDGVIATQIEGGLTIDGKYGPETHRYISRKYPKPKINASLHFLSNNKTSPIPKANKMV